MLKEFRDFIARGNVMDLAVGIIIGAAFTAIVNSLVNDLINPLIGLLTGGVDFSSHVLRFGEGEHAATFRWGAFVTNVINFLIIAWVVFLLVKGLNTVRDAVVQEKEAKPAGPTQEELLTEIRDLLKTRPLPPV
ncbi:MAG: large-conductance mechanosensitive channel protein MscL [Amaricoccus sp.]